MGLYNATILSTYNYPLNKDYTINDGIIKVSPRFSTLYKSESINFTDIENFWAFFRVFVKNPCQMLIRGLHDLPKAEGVSRNKELFKEPEHGLNWFQLDIDEYDLLPEGMVPWSREAIEYFIAKEFMPEFQGVDYVFQFSNSAGIIKPDGQPLKRGLCVHLYYFTDRPVTQTELNSWIPYIVKNKSESCSVKPKNDQIIDHRMFNPIMPHYTAYPTIQEGIRCEIKEREGLVQKGSPHIIVPPIAIKQEKEKVKTKKKHLITSVSTNKLQNLIPKLNDIGCIYQVHSKSVNLFHRDEKSPGGWYIHQSNPDWVFHHSNDDDHRPSRIHEWLATYWEYYDWEYEDEDGKALQPYYTTKRISPALAQRELRRLITLFLENQTHMILKASPGLGKSRETLSLLLSSNKRFHYLVSTHDLGDEILAECIKSYPNKRGIVIKGRGQEGMCNRSNEKVNGNPLIEELPKRGLSVYSHLCKKRLENGEFLLCEHFHACPYLEQFQKAKECDYIILPHNVLVNHQNDEFKLPQPDCVVIDERYWCLFEGQREITLNQLKEYLSTAGNIEKRVLQSVLVAVVCSEPILKHLREDGITLDDLLKAEMESFQKVKHSCDIHPGMEELNLKKILKQHSNDPYSVHMMIKCLTQEYGFSRDNPHSVTVENQSGNLILKLHYRKELQKYKDKSIPILILDADADKMIIEKTLNREFDFYELNVKRSGKVIQIYSSTLATYRMTESSNPMHNEYMKKIFNSINVLIERISQNGKKVLIVCPMKVESGITVPSHCAIRHFNDIRGLDRYKNFDICIVIGRNQLSIKDLEDTTRAIFYDDPDEIQFLNDTSMYPVEERGYRCKIKNMKVEVSYHPDKRCNTILFQTRECESIQATSRIRDIWQPDKEIYLLSNMVLDIDVDYLISFSELNSVTKAENMLNEVKWENEVLPLESAYVANRFGHVWKSKVAYRKYMSMTTKSYQNLINILLKKGNSLCKLYRFKICRNRVWSYVISSLGVLDTIDKLEKIYMNKIEIHSDDYDYYEEREEYDI